MLSKSKALAACAAALALAAAGAARADIVWHLDGLFDDGSALTGSFSINQYGFFGFWDVHTNVEDYTTGSSPTWGDATELDFFPGPYSNALELLFQNDLGVYTASPNPLVVGHGGPSFECRDSFWCFAGDPAQGGSYRWLVSGSAVADAPADPTPPDTYPCPPGVPEPGVWTLMIGGFGLAGAALRRRKPALARVRA